MKQIFLTLLLFFPLSLMAQEETSYEYQPLVVDGKTWTTLRTVDEKWTYLISGDTIFNGHEFYKMLYYVMDPSKNNLQRIGASTILNSDIIFHWR